MTSTYTNNNNLQLNRVNIRETEEEWAQNKYIKMAKYLHSEWGRASFRGNALGVEIFDHSH